MILITITAQSREEKLRIYRLLKVYKSCVFTNSLMEYIKSEASIIFIIKLVKLKFMICVDATWHFYYYNNVKNHISVSSKKIKNIFLTNNKILLISNE